MGGVHTSQSIWVKADSISVKVRQDKKDIEETGRET